MNAITLSPQDAQALTVAVCALTCALMIITIASRGARARAKERARIWGELRAPDWKARAERAREARASGARTEARLRAALMSGVALVALAATNLSAHATITAMARVGLTSVDTAISVIVVFEMFLAILGALSWWHMGHGTGFNRYELGVWTMAALMGGIAWWGGGSPIFALWPLLAAVAWHMVITFGRAHKTSAVVLWFRLKLGRATTRDANALLTERLITRIVNHAYYANVSARAFMRMHHDRAYDRAWARADALGILTPEGRARIQTRIAARYAGARALAPEAVAHMNPWNERASMSARTPRAVRPVSAPPVHALEVSAQVPDDAQALTDERAQESADEETVSAHVEIDVERALEAITRSYKGPEDMREWVATFTRTNHTLPTCNQVAVAAKKSAATCRRWMTPVRTELGLS